MKTIVVKAFSNEGGKKVFVGERQCQEPENVTEMVADAGSEAVALKRYMKSKVIEVQAAIRNKTETPETVKIFKGISAEKQAAILEQARKAGLLD